MKHALLLAGLIAVTAVTGAFGQSTFSIQTYPILGNTHVAADFNGDGKLDLAAPGVTGAAIMLNNGDGTFSAKTEFPLINYPQGIAAGDFNGDGKMDLAVVLQNAQFSMAVLLGTGAGGFGPATYYPNTNGFDSPYALASDINNDGKLDVLIMHSIDCFGPEPCPGDQTDRGERYPVTEFGYRWRLVQWNGDPEQHGANGDDRPAAEQ